MVGGGRRGGARSSRPAARRSGRRRVRRWPWRPRSLWLLDQRRKRRVLQGTGRVATQTAGGDVLHTGCTRRTVLRRIQCHRLCRGGRPQRRRGGGRGGGPP